MEPLPLRPERVHFEVALLLWPADDQPLVGHFELRRARVDAPRHAARGETALLR
ncbi:hypothetical protein WMF11_36510 [Sorangium sp. So ce295]|uniref:hypothetical protein n=1 Tax=Sorangium sp. So ce295 TaxID=3133295 RepID=UPI003F5DD24D